MKLISKEEFNKNTKNIKFNATLGLTNKKISDFIDKLVGSMYRNGIELYFVTDNNKYFSLFISEFDVYNILFYESSMNNLDFLEEKIDSNVGIVKTSSTINEHFYFLNRFKKNKTYPNITMVYDSNLQKHIDIFSNSPFISTGEYEILINGKNVEFAIKREVDQYYDDVMSTHIAFKDDYTKREMKDLTNYIIINKYLEYRGYRK